MNPIKIFILFSLCTLIVSGKTNPREEFIVPNYEEGFINVDLGIDLFYQKLGNGPEKVLIPMGFLLFDDFKVLANENRTLVFYDMRNRGRSSAVKDSTKITIEQDILDLEKIRRHFKFDHLNVIGESYLGLMVILYALKYPHYVKSIVQIGAVPLKSTWWSQYPKELRNDQSNVDSIAYRKLIKLHQEKYYLENDYEFSRMYYEIFEYPNLVADTIFLESIRPRLENILKFKNELYSNYSRHLKFHFENSVSKLEIPESSIQNLKHRVLTIHGVKDRNAPIGSGLEWSYLLPNSRFLEIENAAHIPWIENPELVFNSIDRFLSGQWPKESKIIEERPKRRQD